MRASGREGEGDLPRGWEVFTSQGRWLGRVETPLSFTVFEIGSDYLLGVFEDENGVEHVRLLALRR